MVLVKRKHLADRSFDSALKKLTSQEMKLVHSLALMKFAKKFQEEYREMAELYQKYIAQGDEGKAQVEEFLEGEIELPSLPVSLLEEPKIELSAHDLFWLDVLFEK